MGLQGRVAGEEEEARRPAGLPDVARSPVKTSLSLIPVLGLLVVHILIAIEVWVVEIYN